jgi:hypothetical protein
MAKTRQGKAVAQGPNWQIRGPMRGWEEDGRQEGGGGRLPELHGNQLIRGWGPIHRWGIWENNLNSNGKTPSENLLQLSPREALGRRSTPRSRRICGNEAHSQVEFQNMFYIGFGKIGESMGAKGR